MSNQTRSFRDGYEVIEVPISGSASIGREINAKDRRARDREMEIGRRKRSTMRKVTKMQSYIIQANRLLRESRHKLQNTPQLTYYKTTATQSVHVTNIRGRWR